MDVFFMIFGFFVVFLCITVMYFGLKKSPSKHRQPRSYFESEFERVLKEKENLQKSTFIEQQIETINKAEQQANLNLRKNSEEKKFVSISENYSRPEPHKNKGKIKAYRSSRSLVTVEKEKDNLLFQTIEKMEMQGMTVNEIAKELGRGVREIEIVKRLNEKS